MLFTSTVEQASPEEVYELTAANGSVRRGILTLPSRQSKPRGGIILLPSGLKYHVGAHQLNVFFARGLAAQGWLVLRFDPFGVGESDGQLGPEPVAELWRKIQLGLFVDDALMVSEDLRRRFNLDKIVLSGLCGGAITAQLAASMDGGLVDAAISLNTPINLSQRDSGNASLGATQARHEFREYLKKLSSKDAWLRLIKRKSSFSTIAETIFTTARSMVGAEPKIQFEHENPLFIESFRRLEKRQFPHLLIFSGSDSLWFEFQETFLHPKLSGKMSDRGYEIKVIEQASHVLVFKEWRLEALKLMTDWLSALPPSAN